MSKYPCVPPTEEEKKRINEPRANEVVWYIDNNKNKKLVIINSGQYLDSTYHRLSNFWYWQEINEDGTLGKEDSGYGNFCVYEGKYRVERIIKFE
jgi:hypothetical protein